MKIVSSLVAILVCFFISRSSLALHEPNGEPTGDPSAPTDSKTTVKYKSGKDINFEELLIQGEIKRPELSVVTGDESTGTDGLLRLREDFKDRIAVDFGEEIP